MTNDANNQHSLTSQIITTSRIANPTQKEKQAQKQQSKSSLSSRRQTQEFQNNDQSKHQNQVSTFLQGSQNSLSMQSRMQQEENEKLKRKLKRAQRHEMKIKKEYDQLKNAQLSEKQSYNQSIEQLQRQIESLGQKVELKNQAKYERAINGMHNFDENEDINKKDKARIEELENAVYQLMQKLEKSHLTKVKTNLQEQKPAVSSIRKSQVQSPHQVMKDRTALKEVQKNSKTKKENHTQNLSYYQTASMNTQRSQSRKPLKQLNSSNKKISTIKPVKSTQNKYTSEDLQELDNLIFISTKHGPTINQ
eukprot:403330951